jgi:cytochrome P450
MGDGYILLLGPEGNRLDAFAALHGIVASLALALARRRAAGNLNRRVARQARRLNTLATGLARAFRQGDEADINALSAMMVRAAACGRCGLPHDQLIAMLAAWPLRATRSVRRRWRSPQSCAYGRRCKTV